MSTRGKRRVLAAGAFALVTVTGLWIRSDGSPFGGTVAQHAGTVLWSCALWCVLRLVAPGARAHAIAAVGLAIAWSVELLQITGAPRALASVHPIVRLFTGSDFDVRDLVWLAVGIGAAAAVDTRVLGATGRRDFTGR